MEIGDVVVSRQGLLLASGSGTYHCAVIANLKPFILVSVEGDMLWETIDCDDLIVLCQASSKIVNTVLARWSKYKNEQWDRICKEKYKQLIGLAEWFEDPTHWDVQHGHCIELRKIATNLADYINRA